MNGNSKSKNSFSERKSENFRRRNQAGQVLIESLLLMVLSVSLLGVTLRYFKDQKTFSSLTNAIWAGVAQMAEYGSWPQAKAPVHPNSTARVRLWNPRE